MGNEKLIEKLGKLSDTLNGVAGRLIVASFRDATVKEAHEMVLQVGIEIDDLINELLEVQNEND